MSPVRALTLALLLAVAVPAAARAGEPPTIVEPQVTSREARKVVFTTSVNPGGEAARIRLEFGATTALGAASDYVEVPAGTSPVLVTITLRALPRSTYRWRFRAVNATGSAVSPIGTVTTPAEATRRVIPVVRLSFAVEASRSGSPLGRLLGFTRPSGLPSGTRLVVRCRRDCRGGRAVTLRPGSSRLLRFPAPIVVRRSSVVEIRATRAGYVGRSRGYRFERQGEIVVPVRVRDDAGAVVMEADIAMYLSPREPRGAQAPGP